MKKRSILTAIVAGILSIGLIGCGGSNSSNGDDKVIKVGVSPVPHEEIMEVAKPLLEAKGYKVEIVEFTDYVLPNTSLENGELDANYFQHIAYLNSFNADNGTHLTYTAEIHLEPMGAFSKKYKISSKCSLKTDLLTFSPNSNSPLIFTLLILELLNKK